MNKKLMLISTSSLLAISPLIATISCNKSEDVDNKKLSEAVNSFTITLKTGQNVSSVLASQVKDEPTLLKYFDLGGKKDGFTYTFKTATPLSTDLTKLTVTYEIGYKDKKQSKTVELSGFQNPVQSAFDSFTITLKKDQNVSSVLASQVKDEKTLLTYFDLGGQITGVTYKFESATEVESNPDKLKVIYKISYQGQEKEKTIELSGFKTPTTEGGEGTGQDQTN
ncbi:MAG: hypothetical protein IKB83_01000 [Mycoplasmataceae bacterium]|nr:hypothetical protein [Mycoplasmataceae bacterium]